jgi:peptidoglycan DL-endopeptidase LytE
MRRHIIAVSVALLCLITTSSYVFAAPVIHKVKKGDNLASIAKKHHVSVDALKGLNDLKSIKLSIGQQIIVKEEALTQGKQSKKESVKKEARKKEAPKPLQEAAVTENDGEFIEYKTKKGDTLDKIAAKFNVDVDDLLEANGLTGRKKVSPGKIVLVPKIVEEKEEEFVSLTNRSLKSWNSTDEKYMLVKVAKSFMGAPYKYGGESVRGLDCSAFVKKIYDIFDVQLPRSAREQFLTGMKITKDDLAVGDLVFFRTKRYLKYPTHVGIFIGDGNFIHSSSGHNKMGVKVDSLQSDFYSRTYIGAVRVKKTSDGSADTTNSTDKASNNS